MADTSGRERWARRNKAASVRAFWTGGILGTLSCVLLLIGGLARIFEQNTVSLLFCLVAFLLFALGVVSLAMGIGARRSASEPGKSKLLFCQACECSREMMIQTDTSASEWEPCTMEDEAGAAVKGWEQRLSCTENWECPRCHSVVSQPRHWKVRKKGNHPELRNTGSAGGGTTFGQ